MRSALDLRHAAALALFVLAVAAAYAPVWRGGIDVAVPVRETPTGGEAGVVRADVTFETWLVSRHAKTLVTAPHRLFDTEHCAPAERTLTLGIPMVTMGALAIPVYWLSGDPVVTWNLTLALLSWIGAFAMYALVFGWTGSRGAAIVAGLLYALHPIRFHHVHHPTVWDGTWTVLALLFAERWLSRGRWHDAIGLAAAAALQIGASFYPLIAAVLLGLPYLGWLLARHGLGRVRPGQIAFVACAVVLAAGWLLGPYLSAETGLGDGKLERSLFYYAPLRAIAPGGSLFLGWSLLALAAFGLAARREWLPSLPGDPRWVLLLGAGLAALVATGDKGPLPNLHALLASLLPGFDSVRVVLRVFSGTQLALTILAGLGAAALVRLAGRAGAATATALVLVCAFDVLRAPPLGLERSYRWALEEIRVDPAHVAFFEKLAALGNEGPLLELPADQSSGEHWASTQRILLSLFHGRRTSACFGSYPPPGRERLAELAGGLPEPDAIAELAELGFTTVILHHDTVRHLSTLGRLGRAAERGEGMTHLHSTATHAAFALDSTDDASE